MTPCGSNEPGGHAQPPVQVIVAGIAQVVHTPFIRAQSGMHTQSSLVSAAFSFAGHEKHLVWSCVANLPAAQ